MKVDIRLSKKSQRQYKTFRQNQPKAFRKAIKTGLIRMGLEARGAAASKAPYSNRVKRTHGGAPGTLRRSLTSTTSKDSIHKYSEKREVQQMEIGTNVVYARIQEFGGRTGRGGKGGKGRRGATVIMARNFLTPQIKILKNGRGAKILGEELDSAIKKIT